MPLPACDFDPAEVAVSWQVLSDAGHDVRFTTPSGQPGRADDLMVTGRGLDPWGAVPGLRHVTVVGHVLRANRAARGACTRRCSPTRRSGHRCHWGAARRSESTALLLPGGHPPARHACLCSRAPRSSRWPPTRSVPAGRWGRSATASSTRQTRWTRGPGTPCCTAGGRRRSRGRWSARRGTSPATRVFWDANYYRTYVEEPGQPVGYMSVQQEVARGAGRSGRLQGRVEKDTPDRRRRARTGGAHDDFNRPASGVGPCATAPTSRPAGRADAFTYADIHHAAGGARLKPGGVSLSLAPASR